MWVTLLPNMDLISTVQYCTEGLKLTSTLSCINANLSPILWKIEIGAIYITTEFADMAVFTHREQNSVIQTLQMCKNDETETAVNTQQFRQLLWRGTCASVVPAVFLLLYLLSFVHILVSSLMRLFIGIARVISENVFAIGSLKNRTLPTLVSR